MSEGPIQKVMSKLIKYGAHILFVTSIAVLTYLSFVDNFGINPSVKNITVIALIATVLNWLIWDTFYKSNYEKVLTADANNTTYSIHKRYYLARKNWSYSSLQDRIHTYNTDFRKAWIRDIEDVHGRTEKEIVDGTYKYPHKYDIWKLKTKRYPSTGIKSAKAMLSVLSIGISSKMKIEINRAETFYALKKSRKIVTSLFSTALAGSLIYEFITSNWKGALLKLLLNISMLCASLIFGSMAGIKGANMKLSVAEEVSEKLEEWKNVIPTEIPYKPIADKPADIKVEQNLPDKNVVELV